MDPGKKYNMDKRSRPVGQIYSIGIPLLLVTFIAVCLIVLSAGAYVTARQDYREAIDQGTRAVAYQTAVNRAEEACQSIDTGGALPERTSWDQEKGVITVSMRSGRKLEAGVSQTGGKHRIAWMREIPASGSSSGSTSGGGSASAEGQTVSGMQISK